MVILIMAKYMSFDIVFYFVKLDGSIDHLIGDEIFFFCSALIPKHFNPSIVL